MSDIFITDNFLLQSESAVRLYHDYAKDLPIVDYHCHLPPWQVAKDHRFENMTQIWLAGDHYKWRAMRANGIDERYITGDAPDREKFQKWAETVPAAIRNPLYHWTHLELKRPFGISDRLLNPDTAESIWKDGNAKLAQPNFSCRGIMRQMNVVLVCTTDDPTDSLADHAAVAADASFPIRVLPTFRPDRGMAVANPELFNAWVDKLAKASGIEIDAWPTFCDAIRKRHQFFHDAGCRVSDHGLERMVWADYKDSEIKKIFRRLREGRKLDKKDIKRFQSAVLYECAVLDCEKGWVQQLHVGAQRNNNSRMFESLGPDTGFDSMAEGDVARPLARFLDRLCRENRLPKTIVYNLNPVHNDVLATMIGNFQEQTPGKLQFGSGWWFLDQRDGMTRQIESLSNHGLLSRFVGMLTDSRSFLSYTRHEYFRRILCNILGTEMDTGIVPRDFNLIGGIVRDVSYFNAVRYFDFGLK